MVIREDQEEHKVNFKQYSCCNGDMVSQIYKKELTISN